MKMNPAAALFLSALAALVPGCATSPHEVGVTNQNQPGPAAGRALGAGVGTAVGNVAGGAAGFAEGTAGGIHSSFDSTQRVVRYWRQEITEDGRMIFVPEDFLVDDQGRVIRKMK